MLAESLSEYCRADCTCLDRRGDGSASYFTVPLLVSGQRSLLSLYRKKTKYDTNDEH